MYTGRLKKLRLNCGVNEDKINIYFYQFSSTFVYLIPILYFIKTVKVILYTYPYKDFYNVRIRIINNENVTKL